MKILFPYLARWKTINWTRYHQLLTRLAERGHDVFVVQPPASDMPETNFQEIDIQVPEKLRLIDLPLNRTIWNRKFPLNKLVKKGYYAAACAGKVREIIRDEKIDALMLYNIPHFPMLTKECLTIFDYADEYMDMLKKELGPLANPLVMGFGQRLLEKMIRGSDIVLSVSNYLAEEIRHIKKDVIVLPNGAALDDFRDPQVPDLKLPAGKKVIGFIGSFEYFIDFDLIVSLAARMPQHVFLLVGGGRLYETVKQQTAHLPNVVLTGSVPHSKIAGYIQAMDVCLNVFKKLPVSHAACPLKLFEYLILEKPVISTRLKEVEWIDREFVFYADDVEEMAERIGFIFSNLDTAGLYAKRGRDITLREYSWDSLVDRLVILIEESKRKRAG